MKSMRLIACLGFAVIAAPAMAQVPPQPTGLGDAGKALLGTWEFSNADRDKICSARFKTDRTSAGYKVEFDKNCANLFPLVNEIAGWVFPEGDLLKLLDAQGRALAEFSEVEDGIYEAPTPGVGVLFLQKADAAGPPPKPPEQVAGDFALARGRRAPICAFTLSATPAQEGFALTVKPGCDAAIARLGFAQWRLDRGELFLMPARGNPWRFEEIENGAWRRLPEVADPYILTRQ
jgi:hypothetical protein